MSGFIKKLTRKKYIDFKNVTDTKLARCLSTLDLTALGIGSTLGAGIYVVAGQVAKETAGPSVAISFLIAAFASVLAGLCYAEFGARVPKTGSAYVYSYVTVGEFIAFIIGWNLILEYVIGTASVARAWSSYFDSLINNTIQNFFQENMPMSVTGLSPYPDFFAFGITLLLTVILAVGVKESSTFNNIFTGVNLLVVTYIVICGMFKADIHNWQISPSEIPNSTTEGDGGFMPFGFSGMMSGAATCFYAFVGFDCIATTGEEVKNPQKAIPISIVLSLLFCFVAYFGISAVITLMCPYYLLDSNAPLPMVFSRVGWGVAKYIISVGAICGLSTSLLGAMFPLPRVLYAMATDGIIFRFLCRVNERFKTPLIATFLSGLFAGVMAMLFDLKELVDMMSIGTLLAYTLVGVCVLLLRYKVSAFENQDDDGPTENGKILSRPDGMDSRSFQDNQPLYIHDDDNSWSNYIKTMFNKTSDNPTQTTEAIARWNTCMICFTVVCLCIVLVFADDNLANGDWWAILLVCIFGIPVFVLVYSIWRQPQNQAKINFKVPALPFLPVISVFINIYLMLKLSGATWIRFGVWMFIGFSVYFGYGIWHSSQGKPQEYVQLTTVETSDDDDVQIVPDADEDEDIDIYDRRKDKNVTNRNRQNGLEQHR